MVLHLITCPMMPLWSSISMVTIQEVPKIWIYTYQDAQKNFVNVGSYIKALLPWFPTDDWHLTYMFSLIYFSVEVCLVGECFPIMLAQGGIPAPGSMHPSRWLPFPVFCTDLNLFHSMNFPMFNSFVGWVEESCVPWLFADSVLCPLWSEWGSH